ncbi:hypothetical protein [Hoeflea sp.]|uniref:hypothetical protein n=1 Tax=Hoeflea sp. TaxID=1940281 RepID=UPI003B02E705
MSGPKINRRSTLKLLTGGAILALPGLLFLSPPAPLWRRRIASIVHDTVSDGLSDAQLEAFLDHSMPWAGRVNTALVLNPQFSRLICTEFILNSNLVENGFDIESYEFVEKSAACNPFFWATANSA